MVSHLNPINSMSIPGTMCPMLRGCRDGFPLNEDAVVEVRDPRGKPSLLTERIGEKP